MVYIAPPMITTLLTPKEVAGLLKLTVLTIYDYIHDGKLKAIKLGRGYRVDEKDLELFIKNHRT